MGCVTTKTALGKTNAVGCSKESIPSAIEGELPKIFDAEEYAQLIYDAMAMGKEDLVIKAIQDPTSLQRVEIQEEYRDMFSSDLLQDCHEKLAKKYAFIASMFIRSRHYMAAKELETCLRAGARGDIDAAEVVCVYDFDDLREITKAYETAVVGISLDQEIAESCSSRMAEILRARLSLQVSESHDPGPDETAKKMVTALSTNNLFEGERLFQQCLKTFCLTDLMWTLEYFLQKCQRDITVEIEKHYEEGAIRNNYIALAKLLRNRPLYVATKIHDCIASENDEEQMALVYMILVQDEGTLKAIKNSYRTTFFESLSRDINDEVKDPIIKRVLLRAVK